jgi:hypothetical protein
MVQYVRNNFFAGEEFTDLADAQDRAQVWCAQKAGLRIHGTTCAQPAVVFAEQEAPVLLAGSSVRYTVPVSPNGRRRLVSVAALGRLLMSPK